MADQRETITIVYGTSPNLEADCRFAIPSPALVSTTVAAHSLAVYAVGKRVSQVWYDDTGDVLFTISMRNEQDFSDKTRAAFLAFALEWGHRAEAHLFQGNETLRDLQVSLDPEIVPHIENALIAHGEDVVIGANAYGYKSLAVNATTIPGIVIEHAIMPESESRWWIRDLGFGLTGYTDLSFLLQVGEYPILPAGNRESQ